MTDDIPRSEQGTYKEVFNENEVLGAMQADRKPFVTNSDIADALDCSGETARRKLQKLADEDIIEKEEIGARAVVWWYPGEPERDP